MTDFQISRELLLEQLYAAEQELWRDGKRRLFFEAPERGWLHYVPRLLLLAEGSCHINYVHNGGNIRESVYAPAIFYSSQLSYLKNSSNVPNKIFSFSYYPSYIRAMCINFDGVHTPPTALDIYYHTSEKLSEPGWKILELLDALNTAGYKDSGADILPLLYQVTLDDLKKSESSKIGHVPGLWHKINAYLLDHRNEVLSRKQLAKIFSVSPAYISELCKKHTGHSYSELRLNYQLERAEELLLNSNFTVNEIAEYSGFSCANYFIRRFKSVYGKTPYVYRNTEKK